jgi:hypothetical protein
LFPDVPVNSICPWHEQISSSTGRKNGFGRGLQQPLVVVAQPRLTMCAGAKDL